MATDRRQTGWLIAISSRCGRRARGDAGFTLVELATALLVFAILAAGVARLLWASLDLTRTNRHRSVAAHLASQEMDLVRSADFATLPLGRVTSAPSVDGVPYTVNRDSEWITKIANSSACDGAGGSGLAFLRVTVSVEWANMGGVRPVTSQTVLAPPTGTYDPYTGHIAVKVLDRDAQPSAGRTVTVTGPGVNQTQITTAGGCAFFAYLPDETYTVVVDDSGYVDGQGDPTPSQTAAVSVGATTSLQFDYDREATLDLALTGNHGGAVPPTVSVTIGNTKLLPNGLKNYPGVGGSRTIQSLFPYADGYQVWAGNCLDADPEGEQADGSGPFYPGALRELALPVTPGLTTNGSVTLQTVDVRVRQGALGVPGVTVWAYHDPDNGCPGGSSFLLGTTDANGDLLGALPFGLWRFEVPAGTPQGSWPIQVLDPRFQGSATTIQVDLQ